MKHYIIDVALLLACLLFGIGIYQDFQKNIKEIPDVQSFFIEDLYVAEYEPYIAEPLNWPVDFSNSVIENITKDKWYDDKRNIDLMKFLPVPKAKDVLGKLIELNHYVNRLFKYCSAPFNYWYAETPLEAMLIKCGDCKAYAAYKYHLLKQLGYKNVKIITSVIPDGRGELAGHALVLLNDHWVLDINWPYFYTFEVFRERSGLEKAFDENGIYWLH